MNIMQQQSHPAPLQNMDRFEPNLTQAQDNQAHHKKCEQRIKRGECPTCRRKTHKVSRFLGKREPLTIRGEVVNGHCLICHPIEGYVSRPTSAGGVGDGVGQVGNSAPRIPEMLMVPSSRVRDSDDDDDGEYGDTMTVTSEITMDPCLIPTRRANRPHAMASNFESVLEESPMTEFEGNADVTAKGRDVNEMKRSRRERERHEAMQPKTKTPTRPRRVETVEEEDSFGDSHDLLHPEPPKLLPHCHDFNLSEQSEFSNYSSDGERIDRLCRGRLEKDMESALAKRLDISERSSASVKSCGRRKLDVSERSCGGMQKLNDSNRRSNARSRSCGRRKSGSHSPSKSLTVAESAMRLQSSKEEETSRPQDMNRFSLKRLSTTNTSSSSDTERKSSRDSDVNRFSLNHIPKVETITSERRRKSMKQELDLSTRSDSLDILRDAAAEANGEDALDGLVDVMLASHMDSNDVEDRDHFSGKMTDATYDYSSALSANDFNAIYGSLSKKQSMAEKAAMKSAISQRLGCNGHRDQETKPQLASITDISVILQCVKLHPTPNCIERAYQTLFLLATEAEPEGHYARKDILSRGGIELLHTFIWDNMKNGQVLLALFQALWALSVFDERDKECTNIALDVIHERRVLEGVLFAMQTHDMSMSIQETGFDLLGRLAELMPPDTNELKDAVVLVANNIGEVEPKSKAFVFGLEALISVCQLSDDNKLEFAKAGRDCHASIRRVLKNESASLETRELACRLLWCVTSDRASVSALSSECHLTKDIIAAMQILPHRKSSAPMYECACGTLANLALHPPNHRKMIELGVLTILYEAIYLYEYSEEVQLASCTAIANLSANQHIRSVVCQGGVDALLLSMKSAPNNPDVQCEALRALHILCETSPPAFVSGLDCIIASFFRHSEIKYINQVTCSILAKLSSNEQCRKSMVMLSGTFDCLAKIMKANASKKSVQRAACTLLCNLSKDTAITPILLNRGFVPLVSNAMDAYTDSEELQESACCFYRNLASYSSEAKNEICSAGGIACVIKTIQTLPESAKVQESSCGALGAIIDDCDAHKNIAVSEGAIDAIICLCFVHPNNVEVLAEALGLLASLCSVKKCMTKIVEAGGINVVVETMRSNVSSITIIINGCQFIHSVCSADPKHSNQAVGAIGSIIRCMQQHPASGKLIEATCKCLYCLVRQSECCLNRALAANGGSVVEQIMRDNDHTTKVVVCATKLLDELFD